MVIGLRALQSVARAHCRNGGEADDAARFNWANLSRFLRCRSLQARSCGDNVVIRCHKGRSRNAGGGADASCSCDRQFVLLGEHCLSEECLIFPREFSVALLPTTLTRICIKSRCPPGSFSKPQLLQLPYSFSIWKTQATTLLSSTGSR